jgi:hypothetical protein
MDDFFKGTIYVTGKGLVHTGTATATTASVKVFTEIQMPPFPQEGLHPAHAIHGGDPIGGAWFGIAAAAIYPTARAFFGGFRRDDDE